MSLKRIDLDSALRRFAELRIEDAMREGKFDNLPGRGKPLELDPMPADENARMMWWAIRIMRQNDFTPDEVRLRKQIDVMREELETASAEPRVRFLVTAINAAVRNLNTLGTNAINSPMSPASLELELERLRERQQTNNVRCAHADCRTDNPLSAKFCRSCGRPVAV